MERAAVAWAARRLGRHAAMTACGRLLAFVCRMQTSVIQYVKEQAGRNSGSVRPKIQAVPGGGMAVTEIGSAPNHI